MPRKKKETIKGLHLKFTGKMSVLVELEGHGPIQLRVNDLNVATDIVRLILDKTDHVPTIIGSYNKREENTFNKQLDFTDE